MSCESFLMCNAGMIFGIFFGGFFTMIGSVLFGMLGYCVYTCYLTQQRFSIFQLNKFIPLPLSGIDLDFSLLPLRTSKNSDADCDRKKWQDKLDTVRATQNMMRSKIDELQKPQITVSCPQLEEDRNINIECGKKEGMVFPRAHEIEVYEALILELETTVVRPLRIKLGYESENTFF